MSGDLKIVCCYPEYWEFIRNLRNHPEAKKGFIQQDEIHWVTHRSYMTSYSQHYWVLLKEGNPVGFAGSIDGDIRVAVLPEECGNGYGKVLINHVSRQSPGSCAKVKLHNEASIKLFEACGFKKKYYILEKDDETESL